MAPLVVVVGVALLARILGALGLAFANTWPAAALGLAAVFLLTGSAHFTRPRRDGLIATVPPWVPDPAFAVTVTGLVEFAGAVGLVVPAPRAVSAAILGLLPLALFPGKVYSAQRRRHPSAPTTPLLPGALMQAANLTASAWVVFGRWPSDPVRLRLKSRRSAIRPASSPRRHARRPMTTRRDRPGQDTA